MKIINVSKTDYEWTYDGMNYGPMNPGDVWDVPDAVGHHAIKRSAVVDDEGQLEMFRVEALSKVQADPEWLKSVATYPCPFEATGQCKATPFKDIELLKRHLDEHFLRILPTKKQAEK